MDTLIGRTLQGGKYSLDAELGRGGFGVTYRATHHILNRVVVIKTLSQAVVQDINYAEHLRRFQDEARRLALCNHPNIVRISDFFIEDNRAYMVMDYIPGPTLDAVVFPNNPLPEATALHYIRQIASALKVVHQNGLLHRDVKPQNIILREGTDQVVLIDFGIAREFTPGYTQTHTNLISSGYAPIEQYLTKEKRTPATDVYGLAATLYSLLTAQVPVAAILRDRESMPAPRDVRPDLSPAVNQAVLRGMALDIRYRPAQIDDWLALLPGGQAAGIPPLMPQSQPLPLPTPPNRTEATVPVIPRYSVAGETQAPTPSATEAMIPPPRRRRSSSFPVVTLLLALSVLTLTGVTIASFWFKSLNSASRSTSPAIEPTALPTEEPSRPPITSGSPRPVPSPKPSLSPSPKPSPSASASPQPESSPSPSPEAVRPIPGFPTGVSEGEIKSALGEPTRTDNGVWANTRTALYDLVPGQVTLAYILDRNSNKVRQTEASFAQSVDPLQMQVAVNNMGAPADALDGLKKVYQRQTNEYSFSSGNLKGIIQRNDKDRIYIAIWESDLHD
jgi:serine/threonine-protein kinase